MDLTNTPFGHQIIKRMNQSQLQQRKVKNIIQCFPIISNLKKTKAERLDNHDINKNKESNSNGLRDNNSGNTLNSKIQ